MLSISFKSQTRHLSRGALLIPAYAFLLPALLGTSLFTPSIKAQTQPVPNAVPPAASDSATPMLVDPQPLPYPAGLSLPWRVIGIDPAQVALARPALDASAAAIASAWLQNPQGLSAYLTPPEGQARQGQAPETRPRPLALNLQKRTSGVQVGTPQLTLPAGSSVTLEPTWCSFMDQYIFVAAVADTRRGTLLGSAHSVMARTAWQQAARSGNLGALLTDRVRPMVQEAMNLAVTRITQPTEDALHLAFDLGRNLSRTDEGASHCLNLLLEASLARDHTVVRSTGSDMLASVRRALGAPPELRRPTRRLVLRWHPQPDERRVQRVLPVTLRLTASLAESVLGRHVPLAHTSEWTFAANPAGDQLNFNVDPSFRKIISDEKASLALADWPQVAKIDRAWVYLDRGRAWGLNMADRLIAEVDGEMVKGHVVRFFGPEAGLVSPRGYPIREGAIVYIRKGQRLTRLGLEFRIDPRTYPTPWPPEQSLDDRP